jgi:uncharacterized OB-fold protein
MLVRSGAVTDTAVEPEPPKPFRVLPAVLPETKPFWTGGEVGELRFWKCDDCGYIQHPPSPRCPRCLSKNLSVTVVSGRATVHTFTVNHQPWYPNLDPPYVVAIVTIEEQDDVRLTTNIVNCAPEDVSIGMPVQVTFDQYDNVWLPMFEPASGATS